MRISPSKVLGGFDERTRGRAQGIADAGLVLSWEVHAGPRRSILLIASVGSESLEGLVYKTSLAFGDRGELALATCSCPVGSWCKHCAALALAFFTKAAESGPSIVGATYVRKAAGRGHKEATAQDLAKLAGASGPREEVGRAGQGEARSGEMFPPAPPPDPLRESRAALVERFRLPEASTVIEAPLLAALARVEFPAKAPRTGRQSERWRLAFAVSAESSSLGGSARFEFWKALRYVKKDGEAGRLRSWKRDLLSESLEEPDLALLSRFTSDLDDSLPLSEVLDLLLSRPPSDLNFVLGRPDNASSPLVLAGFGALRLAFPAWSWDERTKRLLFGIETRLEGLASPAAPASIGEGRVAIGAREGMAAAVAGRLVVISPRLGLLAIADTPALALAPLASLVGSDLRATRGDIAALAARYSERGPSAVLAFDLPPEELELRRVQPRPELRLEEAPGSGGSSLVAELVFDYEGSFETPSEPESGRWTFGGPPEARKKDSFTLEEGSLVLRARDAAFEARLYSRVAGLLEPALEEQRARTSIRGESGTFLLSIDESRFLADLAPALLDAGLPLRFEGQSLVSPRRSRAGLRLESVGGWFEGRFVLEDAEGVFEELELEDPREVFGRGRVEAGGRIWLLDPKDRAALSLLLDRWDDASKGLRIGKEDFGRLELASERSDEAGRALLADRLALGKALAAAFARAGPPASAAPGDPVRAAGSALAIPAESLPKGLRAQLRPYQKAGYDRLCFMYAQGLAALLADDMGLGKTLQTLALFARLKEKKDLGLALVVAPLTLLSNWEAEAARFTPKLKVMRHHGPGRARSLEAYTGADILVTTYQTLRADQALFEGTVLGFLALDEAQTVKNPDAAAFAAVKALRARRRISITGTPVENRPLELWAQFDLILPGLLDTRKRFEARFSKPLAGGEAEAGVAASLLRRLVAPFIIRRKKEDVLPDLPPKEEIVRRLELGPKQAAVYEKLRAAAEQQVRGVLADKGVKRSAITVFEALLRLRQAAVHPGLGSASWDRAGSAKFAFLLETLEELVAEGHRVLVFSQFVQVLSRVEALLSGTGMAWEYLDGQTRDRQGALARFKEGQAPVFLLSLKAGGLGVNLPEADYVILLDPWWNPAVEAQAVDRAHRIGQEKKVIAYKFITSGTIEEKMLVLQQRKQALSDTFLPSWNPLKDLSPEEITGLFL